MSDPRNVHLNDREIPAGKVLLAGRDQNITKEQFVRKEVLEAKMAFFKAEVRLTACHAGWAIAGAATRWDNGTYAVLWESNDGSNHGRHYRNYDDAKADFDRIRIS